MGNYLKNKIFKLANIFIVLAFYTVSAASAVAVDEYRYYSDKFSDFGIDALSLTDYKNVLENNVAQTQRSILNFFYSKVQDASLLDRQYFLILSSDISAENRDDIINTLNSVNPSTIILICDSEFILSENIECNYSGLGANTIADYDINGVRISKQRFLGKDLITVPAIYLLSPEYYSVFGNYMRAYDRSVYPKAELNKIAELKYLNDGLLKLAQQATYVLILIAVFRYLFVAIINKPKTFTNPKTYLYIFGRIERFFQSTSKLYLSLFVPLLIVYTVSLISISIKDVGFISIEYISNYVSNTFLILMGDTILSLSASRLIIFPLGILVIFLGILICIPLIISFIKIGINRIRLTKLKLPVRKVLLAFIPILLLFSIFAFSIDKFIPVILILGIIYVLLLMANENDSISDIRYTKNQKRMLIIFVSLALTFGIYLRYADINSDNKRPNQRLINDGDRIVVLPYTKDYKHEDIFDKYFVEVTDPIFIDQYMVADPQYNEIESTPLSNFNSNSNFIVVNSSSDEFALELIQNTPFRAWYMDKFKGNSKSKFFLFDNSNSSEKDKFEAEISYKCERDLGTNKFLLKVFHVSYLVKEEPYGIIEVFNNPSCLKGQTVNVRIPVDFNNVPEETVLLNFVSGDAQATEDVFGIDSQIKFFKNNLEADMTPVNYNKNNKIIAENYQSLNGKLIAYYFGEGETITFTRDSESVDLSELVNSIIKLKTVESPIVIWSTKDNYIIKNFYND